MTDAFFDQSAMAAERNALSRWETALAMTARATPSLLFGLRLWAAVCLSLYVAFWLQLDNAFWAGTTAGVVCRPQLGASLRKSWFRMIGTPVGAAAIVILTACFPQDRALFLICLALWAAACTFVSTLLRNFASYAAGLAGFTAVIIAGDTLGATGGASSDVFMVAVTRVSEIVIGIVSAGVVHAGTDLGSARGRLATLFRDLTAGITVNFGRTLQAAGPELPDTRPVRRDFIRRVIALDPVVDESVGESSQIRYHSPVLHRAIDGLVAALAGWRTVANHLARLPDNEARVEAATILQCLPPKLLSVMLHADPAPWTADPAELRWTCEAARQRLVELPAATPSLRLLADKAAETLMGISGALAGLALLIVDPTRPVRRRPRVFRLRVPHWLPALVDAGRTLVTIGLVELFWVVSAWPNGATAIVFAAIVVILHAPRAHQAYAAAISFAAGCFLAVVFAAIIAFAVLPGLKGFAAFCIALSLYLVPVGALSAQPWQRSMFVAMASYFSAFLGAANQMTYDTLHFYNVALGIVAGAGAAAMSFRLLPPLSPAFRARRLQMLTLHDLRRLAMGRTFSDWEGHIHDRLSAMPQEATPLQRAEVLAAMSLGTEIIRLRPIAGQFGLGARLEVPLSAVAQGRIAAAIGHFIRLDEALESYANSHPEAMRVRGSMIAISEVLTQHADYFDSGAE